MHFRAERLAKEYQAKKKAVELANNLDTAHTGKLRPQHSPRFTNIGLPPSPVCTPTFSTRPSSQPCYKMAAPDSGRKHRIGGSGRKPLRTLNDQDNIPDDNIMLGKTYSLLDLHAKATAVSLNSPEHATSTGYREWTLSDSHWVIVMNDLMIFNQSFMRLWPVAPFNNMD